MKTKKRKSFLCMIMLFCVISSVSVNAQETKVRKTWKEINLAEQIPEASLSTMPTEELIKAYLNSRFPRYLIWHNDIETAFRYAYNDFNGLRELLKREDAAQKLIEFYQKMDTGAYDLNWEPVKKGAFTFSFVFIEVLLAHESILNKLTKSEAKTLLAELLKKHELKTLHPQMYSMYNVQFNAYSLARLLESKGKDSGVFQTLSQTPGIVHLLKAGRLQDKDALSVVIQKAKEFLNTY